MLDDGDKDRKGVYFGHRGTAEVDAPGVCAQVRFVIQDVAQRAHERWPEDRDVVEQKFASNVVPTFASREDSLSTQRQLKFPRASTSAP